MGIRNAVGKFRALPLLLRLHRGSFAFRVGAGLKLSARVLFFRGAGKFVPEAPFFGGPRGRGVFLLGLRWHQL